MSGVKIKLFNVINSLSRAIDLISETLIGHHQKVTYISSEIARELNLKEEDQKNLLLAALIHDIGVFHLDQKFSDLSFDTKDNLHALVGFELLKSNSITRDLAEIIRDHHKEWSESPYQQNYLSHILFLADRISVLIKENIPILNQSSYIKNQINHYKGTKFYPEAVDIFNKLAEKEYFWLNLISGARINSKIHNQKFLFKDELTKKEFLKLSKIFSHIIDFRSPFTAAHSQGVAAAAVVLSNFMDFSEEKKTTLEIAGYLHDIGKLNIPQKILNKKGELTEKEFNIIKTHSYYTYRILTEIKEIPELKNWAGFHHERLNGEGYPFHYKEKDLSCGSKIMAVSDIFAALSEDRPYRKGMGQEKVIDILNNMVENKAVDKKIVSLLIENYEFIDERRKTQQKKIRDYFEQFKSNIELIKKEEDINKIESYLNQYNLVELGQNGFFEFDLK